MADTPTAEERAQRIPCWPQSATGKYGNALIAYIAQAIREAESAAYARGFVEAECLDYEPAKCGHARANWKDPNWGTPDYKGEEKCEACAAVAAARIAGAGDMRERAAHEADRFGDPEIRDAIRELKP